jgi:hypothetical protein
MTKKEKALNSRVNVWVLQGWNYMKLKVIR